MSSYRSTLTYVPNLKLRTYGESDPIRPAAPPVFRPGAATDHELKETRVKFFRFGARGRERPGVLDASGTRRDLSGVIDDLTGEHLDPRALQRLAGLDLSSLPKVPGDARLGACVGRVGHFIGVGVNYADHAAEAGFAVPKEPILFNKAPSCIVGPNDDVRLPPGSEETDWEVELAVVIGAHATYLKPDEVEGVIAGYCICNDLSERAFQMKRGGQFMKGKGCPTFGPLGPWLVTPDEIKNVQDLRLWLRVNGEAMQDSSTREMLFDAHWLVAYISQFMTLEPGDVITTGTPAGVGLAKKPPRYLKIGDVVELGVHGLGTQRQRVIADSSAD
jgi:2,4-diketo-3-deoxy-L-fuconate hydrolase